MGERIRRILRWVLGGDAVETVRLGPYDHGGVADRELDGLAVLASPTSIPVPLGRVAPPEFVALSQRPALPPRAVRTTLNRTPVISIDKESGHHAMNYRGWKNLVQQLYSGRAPAGIVVDDDLVLAKLRLRSLPPGFVVRGTLDLRSNQRLRRIGDGLNVGGDLLIGGKCRGETWWDSRLKRDAEHGEPVVATLAKFSRDHQCPLAELPRGVKIGGDLLLQNCRYIECLPDDLEVGQSICLIGCTELSHLPGAFPVQGNLVIVGARSLRSLPSLLEIDGNLWLTGVPVSELPVGLRVGGNITLECCSRLVELASGLVVGGSVLVRRCPMERLGERVQIKGNLRLVDVPVKSLPAELRVGGDLVLERCSELRELPAGLEIGGSLVLRDCAIERLPAGLCAGENIRISRAYNLKCTPEGLSAKGCIELVDCDSLVRIAPGIRVGGDLVAKRCANLRELPEGLQVPRTLDRSLDPLLPETP
jgi:hypothetical protein